MWCQLSCLAANGWIAEEPERWDRTSQYTEGALVQPLNQALFWSHLAQPCKTNDGTRQKDHDIGTYVPYSFRTMSRVLVRPFPTGVQWWRRHRQRLNVTAQWCDHLNWERNFTAGMISPVFLKEVAWWSGRGSRKSRPPARQAGALPIELTTDYAD